VYRLQTFYRVICVLTITFGKNNTEKIKIIVFLSNKILKIINKRDLAAKGRVRERQSQGSSTKQKKTSPSLACQIFVRRLINRQPFPF
jgi:hypothetical protein